MFFLYSILYSIGFLILLPRFLYDGLTKGKYAAGFRERLGDLPRFEKDQRSVLWLHAVSVGETNAAKPLLDEIVRRFPELRIIVSTTTETGQTLAKQIFSDYAERVFYLPFDWKFSVRRTLNHFKPSIVLIMETELWFNFIREADRSGARVFIVNGRISEKSHKRYLRINKLVKRVFKHIQLTLVQDKENAKRLLSLGIRAKKIKITGNLKFDRVNDKSNDLMTDYFRERFDISKDAPLIIAASTHEPEERWILEAFRIMWKNSPEKLPRLLIAPRHPERFDEIYKLIKNSGFEWTRRTDPVSRRDKAAEIILLDSIGELQIVFPFAEVVFVGGSLIPHGGQNILEPAMFGKAIVTGFYTSNFKSIIDEFLNKDSLIQLPELDKAEIPIKLAEVFTELFEDKNKREILQHNSLLVVKHNVGAVGKTLKQLEPYLKVHTSSL